ncbi:MULTISPECIES: hypothetical protein [unclassified Cupriavidus]|uniref:hypothetical protein n=1 Tax=unclassified Cupriavidus TaxID=2640874 RepID=UPI0010F93CF1|nr:MULTISPECIES: hypothetical protein [unclassified Cupriavidus]MWL92013.1 hypothetical protein [Cupriavidus sp. SW-Y-13]
MFERIDALITTHDFAFQAWQDRYGKGVWAALGVWENMIDTVRDLSSAGDLDMIPAMEYVFSVDWLPMETGRTLNEAMAALEAKLAALPQEQLTRGSEWTSAVSRAIEDLRDTWNAVRGYGDLDGKLPKLPADFAELGAAG